MDAKDILRRAKAIHKEQGGKLPISFQVTIDGSPFGTEKFTEIEETQIEVSEMNSSNQI